MDFNAIAQATAPNKTLMVIGQKTLSYGEQWQRVHALINWCKDNNIEQGHPILVAVNNEYEQASLLLALMSSGYPPLIFDPKCTPSEASVILDNSEFVAIIAEPDIHEKWQLQNSHCPWLPIVPKAKKPGFLSKLIGKKPTEEKNTWPSIANARITPTDSITINDDTLSYIVFTSGTTSRPKGVEISHLSLAVQMDILREQYRTNEQSRILNTLPLHHADGILQGPLLAWCSGATVHRPVVFSVQNLPEYLNSIKQDRITHMIAVPTMLSLMARLGENLKDKFSGSDFQFILSCAGHLEEALWQKLEDTLGVRVANLYGLSETCTSVLISGPDDNSHLVGSLGKPVNSEVRLVDDNGNEVAQGETGELWIRSNQLMRGYHKNPTGTDEILVDGWLHSGDLLKQLNSGHYALVGRKKSLIVSGGRNISPEEVMSVLNKHDQVIDSVVLGAPDQEWGEKVVAIVVKEATFSESELIDWCRVNLSEYKVPKQVIFTAELPKGPSGKIRLEEVRKLLTSHAADSAQNENDESSIPEQLKHIAASTFRMQVSDIPDKANTQNIAAWDSLAHMELIVAIEHAFNIKFTAQEAMQLDSLKTAETLIADKQ